MITQTQVVECDVVVIGAGPAGSSAAAILAGHGRRVIMLERQTFPRYRIGESLIPYCWFPLRRLGMIERIDAAACTIQKHSVQFVGLDGKQTTPFYFASHTDHDCARTWQVVRSAFDQLLLENATDKGAEVRFGLSARQLLREGETNIGVAAADEQGQSIEFRAPMTIDASGRECLSLKERGWRIDDPHLRKIALWTYYTGAKRDEGIDEGATTVAYLPDKGWFWYIPLPDDKVSVGIVCERDYLYREPELDPKAMFEREAKIQPWIAEHLAGATQVGEFRVTGDYSYRSRYCAADGLVLAGDAFGFLDPVFSSGVFLALYTGVLAGDAVHEALAAGDVSASRFAAYGEKFRSAIEAMRRLVYAFYDTDFSFGTFLKAHPEFRSDLTDCLIGNVERDFNPLFNAASEFADIPAPLPHGQPLTSPTGRASRV
ncbi:MAG: tryptophan 7-halogenase [Phycisphaerales bacterium]|nr:tryptophan 7-halogenase [Phycisphaerales bacterium]